MINPSLKAWANRTFTSSTLNWLLLFVDLSSCLAMFCYKTNQYFYNKPIMDEYRYEYPKAHRNFSFAYLFYWLSAQSFVCAAVLDIFNQLGILEKRNLINAKRASEHFYGSVEGSSFISIWILMMEGGYFIDKNFDGLEDVTDFDYEVSSFYFVILLFLLLFVMDFFSALPNTTFPFFILNFVVFVLTVNAEEGDGTFGDDAVEKPWVGAWVAGLSVFFVIPAKLHLDMIDRRGRCASLSCDIRGWSGLITAFFYSSFYVLVIQFLFNVHFFVLGRNAKDANGNASTLLDRYFFAVDYALGRLADSWICARSEELEHKGLHQWYGKGAVSCCHQAFCCCLYRGCGCCDIEIFQEVDEKLEEGEGEGKSGQGSGWGRKNKMLEAKISPSVPAMFMVVAAQQEKEKKPTEEEVILVEEEMAVKMRQEEEEEAETKQNVLEKILREVVEVGEEVKTAKVKEAESNQDEKI